MERDKERRIIIQIKKHLDDFYEIVFIKINIFFHIMEMLMHSRGIFEESIPKQKLMYRFKVYLLS